MSSNAPDPTPAPSKAPSKPSPTTTPAAPSSPARSAKGGSAKPGNKPKAKVEGEEKEKKSGGGGRGGGRGGSTSSKKDAAPPAAAPSEGLSNLQSMIASLKDDPLAAGTASPPRSTSSPSTGRPKGGSHRKTASGNANTPTINVPPPQSSLPPSNLNPYAGGFLPGTLGPISDMRDEALITPTASQFDLMTGRPRGVVGEQEFVDYDSLANGAEIPGFGPVAGMAASSFNFPQSQQSIAQQQHFLQIQQQQQQFQMQQQLAALQYGGIGGMQAAANQRFQQSEVSQTNDLIAEQLAIQQQLESLRLQQENLLLRFGDMQNASLLASSPILTQNPSTHRRVPSAQSSAGTMGSFGQGLSNFAPQGGSPSASNLPRGHGRRNSVNAAERGSFGSPSYTAPSPAVSNSSAFSPAMGHGSSPSMGGFNGGFQFPNNGGQRQDGESDLQRNNSGGGHIRRQSGSNASLGGWSMNNTGQSNLAEAQAHLQQLALYRASAGHSRVPSFGMSSLGGGPGQLAMAGYGGGITPQSSSGNGQQRKSLFAPYLPQASIPPLIAAGKLVIGVLRVNKKNRSDAYVATDLLESDIYVCGSKDRNRALEGDVVAIELLDVDEVWGTKKAKEEKKRRKEEFTSNDPRATRDLRKSDKKKDDVEVEGQGLLLLEEEEVTDDQRPQFAGHVVAVVERAPGQLFSGMLGVLRPSSAATQQKHDAERRDRDGFDSRNNASQQVPKVIWFRPTDKRVPLIAIPTEQAPRDFIDRPDKYSDRLFVACIKRWPITSLHPFGTLVEELGPVGDIETETSALLKDCNFSTEDFSESVVKCLPPTPWTIPEREESPEVRRDFRDHRVFTIDPETAKDLDDALHVVKNDDGTFEVGVHIADVTHFVKPNTALDREAKKRATTVYLTQRAVPMLPHILSETLCSLNPGADKLTFSVVFTMTPDAKIVSTWFGKALIRSAAKLAYADAQEVIEGRHVPESKVPDKDVRAGVESDILLLASLARHLRAGRFEGGALRIDNVKISFGLDEGGFPDDCSSFVRREANELIEEFMLLANISVAGKIAAGLPDQSLLRRHEAPIDRRLTGFIERMKRLDITLDGSSSGALMKSIDTITDPSERMTLQHLSTKSMQRAKYFCTGMLDITKYSHYALNVPLYTHFTSPIRRYADVMVHRMLEAVLLSSNDAKFHLDPESISKVAQTCNIKKDAAQLASEQSAHLFLCVLIDDLTKRYGAVVRMATVIGVLDQAFDVLVPEFGIEKRAHLDQMPTESHSYDEATNTLEIRWKRGVNTLTWLAESQNDHHLQRVRTHADTYARLLESTSASTSAEVTTPEGASPKSSAQHVKSQDRSKPKFEDATVVGGHHIQKVRELQSVPVCITSDLTISPPVIKVVALNPFA